MNETVAVTESPIDGDVAVANAIEIEDLYKSYGRTRAVNGLSMRAPRGSIYGFVGPNGAGKTTTIRTIATLQRPDAGIVRVEGFDVRENAGAVRDRIGYMPDFFGVYESLTVFEYLDFYGAAHRIAPRQRRQLCDELLELVDLTDKRRASVETLSRGMKQRLGLARCLVHDPSVLLLDEPASGMDPRARFELREILRELGKLQKTILISSHILPELAEMCTHIGIIRDGRLLTEGPVEAVIAALSPDSRLHIRLLEGRGMLAAREMLARRTDCTDAESDGNEDLVARFSGDEDALVSILGELVRAGVPVVGFTLETGSLEDIFLQITERAEGET